eukprot:g1143.t1
MESLFVDPRIQAGLFGGALIGFSSLLFALFFGKIAGISGMFGRSVLGKLQNADDNSALPFLAALSLSGFLASHLKPELLSDKMLSVDSQKQPLAGIILGGFLVGLGSALQNGCTSGHGVMGLSRISPKSFVLVCTFMLSGMIFASVLRPLLLPSLHNALPTVQTISNSSISLLPILIASSYTFAAISDVTKWKMSLAGGISGLIFGTGLLISGMASPSTVLGFLDVSDIKKWNPSLAAVMIGAIAIALPGVRWIQQKTNQNSPIFVEKKFNNLVYFSPASWGLFAHKQRALIGAICFGFGWALCGVCPGPGLVVAGAGTSSGVVYFFAMISGFYVESKL